MCVNLKLLKLLRFVENYLKWVLNCGKDFKLSNFFRNIGKNVVFLKLFLEEMMEINYYIL